MQVIFYLKQMAPEEADEKYENVMRQRHMFIYKTEYAAASCMTHCALRMLALLLTNDILCFAQQNRPGCGLVDVIGLGTESLWCTQEAVSQFYVRQHAVDAGPPIHHQRQTSL